MKLSAVFLVLLAACSSPSPPSPKAPAATPGRAERFQIGDLEAYVLADGSLALPNDGKTFGVGRPPADVAAVLTAAGLPTDNVHLDIQCLLVKADDHVLLFDTGAADATWADAGHLLASLELAGTAPDAITDIFISHVHGDHVSGLITKAGTLAFPNATIHMTTLEWTFFQSDAEAESKHLVSIIAPKVVPFEPGAQLLPAVRAVDTRGHTPGHSSYEIGATEKLLYIGDLAHHSIISVQHPDWSIQFDMDRAAAEPMRQQTLTKLAADHTRIFAVHFPYPGLGHITSDGTTLTWQPEAR